MFGFNIEGFFKKYKIWVKGIFYYFVFFRWEVVFGVEVGVYMYMYFFICICIFIGMYSVKK